MNTKELKQALKDEIQKIESSPDMVKYAGLQKQMEEIKGELSKMEDKTWGKAELIAALERALIKLK